MGYSFIVLGGPPGIIPAANRYGVHLDITP